MTKSATLSVNDGKIRETVNSFLKELFTKKAINAMLVPYLIPPVSALYRHWSPTCHFLIGLMYLPR